MMRKLLDSAKKGRSEAALRRAMEDLGLQGQVSLRSLDGRTTATLLLNGADPEQSDSELEAALAAAKQGAQQLNSDVQQRLNAVKQQVVCLEEEKKELHSMLATEKAAAQELQKHALMERKAFLEKEKALRTKQEELFM